MGSFDENNYEGEFTEHARCRFRKLYPCVSMVQSAEDRLRDDISDQFDPASAGSILPKRKVSARLVIVRGVFCKDAP